LHRCSCQAGEGAGGTRDPKEGAPKKTGGINEKKKNPCLTASGSLSKETPEREEKGAWLLKAWHYDVTDNVIKKY